MAPPPSEIIDVCRQTIDRQRQFEKFSPISNILMPPLLTDDMAIAPVGIAVGGVVATRFRTDQCALDYLLLAAGSGVVIDLCCHSIDLDRH